MNFIDEALLEARAGNGGAGCTSFREKNSYHEAVLMVEMAVREGI